MDVDSIQKRKQQFRMDTGNLLRVTLVEGDGPAVSDSKLHTVSAPLGPRDLNLTLCREEGRKKFHCPKVNRQKCKCLENHKV